MSEAPPPGTQAIGRALSVLQAIAASSVEMSSGAIAVAVGLSSGTTNRILRALMTERFVSRNPKTDSYYLGTGTVLLGQAAQRGFGVDKMIPILEGVNAATGESVNLAIRQGDESVVLTRVQSQLPLRFEQRAGARFPLYATASGKSIMAFSPDRHEYTAALPDDLPPLTPYTIRSRDEFARQVEATRERGYSIDEQENVEGVRCVGAPILDTEGKAQAALVIQVPTVRLPVTRVPELAALIVAAAKEAQMFVPVDRPLSP